MSLEGYLSQFEPVGDYQHGLVIEMVQSRLAVDQPENERDS